MININVDKIRPVAEIGQTLVEEKEIEKERIEYLGTCTYKQYRYRYFLV
jgi:hypothetical protein